MQSVLGSLCLCLGIHMSVSIGKVCKKCDLDPLDAAKLLSSKSDQPFFISCV
jgi:hypothetical protein